RDMPLADLFRCERLNFDVAKPRQDEGFGAVAGVVAALAVPVHELEVRLDGVAYGERAVLAGGMVGAGDHAFAGLGLGLAIVEHGHAVSVRIVIGGGDGLDHVGLVPDIVPRNPLTRPAERLSVAEMESGFGRPGIRLAARLKTTAGRSGFLVGVAYRPGQAINPPCPIFVQYTRVYAHGQGGTLLLILLGFPGQPWTVVDLTRSLHSGDKRGGRALAASSSFATTDAPRGSDSHLRLR